jgi:hypothetical protein
MHWTDEQVHRIWTSLTEVGIKKAAGYLPLHTVETLLGKSLEEVARSLTDRGICVRILPEDQSPIKSGALFAFDRPMAKRSSRGIRMCSGRKTGRPIPIR